MTHATQSDFQLVEEIVQNAHSSFSLGMKALPAGRRGYLFAIYAYCRVLDDIADEEGSEESKLGELANWRNKIDQTLEGKPDCSITRILCDAVSKFSIPTIELYKLIDGMEADARGPIQKPSWDELYDYCRCVAVSVGLLSLPIFGRDDEEAQAFAIELGFALQLTNILRDVAEDWEIERLYLPAESLDEHQVDGIASSSLHKVLKDVSIKIDAHYEKAEQILKSCGQENLRPAMMMMAVYKQLFEKMKRRGWHQIEPRVRLSTMEKAMTVTKMLAFG
ncbi:squalene/phytoene synthase family protein [Terasakiella sp. A23]|uniref:phytoene/squalene synthase family protein n=1 Tax=Terasakiella sp. FCG-A23 TaxID=3080561 RepID=UPI00295532E7|nr:squalene/phytoene synthase family protein [Terasakiella sp. A23]MDV7338782.1 squalene/phytoene synthase family protein [Terasakiella sp. A23]